MKKLASTVAATLVLSVGLVAVPAHAEEPAACAESQGREVLLGYTIDGLEKTIEVMNADLVWYEQANAEQAATIDTQRATIVDQQATLDRQAAKIKRLQAKLARR